MGKIKQGILGGFLGKVGGVVGGNFKGIATMRAMPLSVANPRTAAQQTNRARFQLVSQLFSIIGVSFIRTYWNRMAVKMSGYNLICQTNKNCFDENDAFLASGVIMSDGIIAPVTVTSASYSALSGVLSVAGTYGTGKEQLSTDLLTIVAVNAVGNVAQVSDDFTVAEVGDMKVTLDEQYSAGDHINVYVCARRADGTQFARNTYNDVIAGA